MAGEEQYWTDAEVVRVMQAATEQCGGKLCENRMMLSDVAHYAPELDRCQVVLGHGNAPKTLPEPWMPGPYGTNIAAVVRCSRCRANRPNAWLTHASVPLVKGYLIGLGADGKEHVIDWTYLKQMAGA